MKDMFDNSPMNQKEIDDEIVIFNDQYLQDLSKDMSISIDELKNGKIEKSIKGSDGGNLPTIPFFNF